MSSMRRNMTWMAASQAGVFITQFTMTIFIARLLTPYEMGVFAAALAVVGLIAIVRNLGLGSYLIRADALTPSVLATTFTINALMALLISTLVVTMSVAGGALLNEPGVRKVLLVIAAVPLVSILEFRPATVMERNGRFSQLAAVNLLRTLTGAALTIVLAYHGHTYMSLAYGQLAGGVVAAVAFNLLGWRDVSLRLGLDDWRPVLRYGAHMFAITISTTLAGRVAELALARLLGLAALGMYSRAAGVPGMVWESVHLVVTRALFVNMAEERRQGRSLRETYLKVIEVMTALLWPAFSGLAVLSGPVLLTLYGPQWTDAQVPLSLLALSSLPSVAMVAGGGLLTITGRTADQARLETIRSVIGLALFLGGCLMGLSWAAGTRILEAVLAYGLYRKLIQQMSNTREMDFTPIYLRSLALTGVAVGPAFGVMCWYSWSPTAATGPVVAATLAGIMLWATLLAYTKHPLFQETTLLVARLRHRAMVQRRPL